MAVRPRQELTPQQKRIGLMFLCGLLLLCSGPCLAAPFGDFKGHHVGPTQSQAYKQFQSGDRLSDEDVAALAGDDDYVSPAMERDAAWKGFWFAAVVFILPASSSLFICA